MRRFGLMILVFIPFILLSCCQETGTPDEKALSYYSRGSYRRASEILLKKQTLSDIDRYVLARSMEELGEVLAALSNYSMLSPSGAAQDEMTRLLSECLVYRQFQGIGKLSAAEVPAASNLIRSALSNAGTVSEDSPYAGAVRSQQLRLYWDLNECDVFGHGVLTNREALIYARFARFRNGDTNVVSSLFEFDSDLALDLTGETISGFSNAVLSNMTLGALKTVLPRLLSKGRYAEAETAIGLLAAGGMDAEYLDRQSATVLFRKGQRNAAFQKLSRWMTNTGTGEATVRLLVGELNRDGRTDESIALLKRFSSKYPNLIPDYLRLLNKRGHLDALEAYYKSRRSDDNFVRRHGIRIFRYLLPERPESAGKLLSRMREVSRDSYYLYIQSLLHLEKGRRVEGLKGLSRILLTEPLSYEWWVASEYYPEMVSNASVGWKASLEETVTHWRRSGMVDRLSGMLAQEILSPGWLESRGLTREFNTALSDARASVVEDLTNTRGLEAASEIMSRTLSHPYGKYFGQDVAEYIDRMLKSPRERERFYFQHIAEYRELGQEGKVLSALNARFGSLLEGRQNHLLLPPEILGAMLYPPFEEEKLLKISGSTDWARWLKSAFREESHFNKKARSWVGATGVSQLMPQTASLVAKGMKHPEYTPLDYDDNLEIGAVHLTDLLKRYNGKVERALAAYNAGEGAVARWNRNIHYGPALWTECIDYEETRNYVRKIRMTYEIYRVLERVQAGEFSVASGRK